MPLLLSHSFKINQSWGNLMLGYHIHFINFLPDPLLSLSSWSISYVTKPHPGSHNCLKWTINTNYCTVVMRGHGFVYRKHSKKQSVHCSVFELRCHEVVSSSLCWWRSGVTLCSCSWGTSMYGVWFAWPVFAKVVYVLFNSLLVCTIPLQCLQPVNFPFRERNRLISIFFDQHQYFIEHIIIYHDCN